MAYFGMDRESRYGIRLEKPLEQVPMMRWERKMVEAANRTKSESNFSLLSNVSSTSLSKTPMKSLSNLPLSCNSSSNIKEKKSSSKNSALKSKSPGRYLIGTTSTDNLADRFIPNRNNTQIALGQFIVSKNAQNTAANEDEVFLSPAKLLYQKTMNENLNGDLINSKIISYCQKPPELKDAYKNDMKVLYSSSKNSYQGLSAKPTRHIPQGPERILDAPELKDDYYLNLLDWSSQNILAVCLGPNVYLWNGSTGAIEVLLELSNPNDYVSSIAWGDQTKIGVGLSNNEIQLWDVQRRKKLRTMSGHIDRVGALSWNDNILSSGSRSGNIHHHDVNVMNHLVGSFSAHSQEVCGLKWSPDGKYLASGGNDNVLNIYSAQTGFKHTGQNPLYTMNDHMAAVKALAWCPWQNSLLASGGGTADKHIRFWNCNTGSCVNSINTRSQVCSLLWSTNYHELISSHGFHQNQLIIWTYPKLEKIAELTGHTSRVLYLAMSPDGSIVVSGAGDETLRLWKCFAVDPNKKKIHSTHATASNLGENNISHKPNIR